MHTVLENAYKTTKRDTKSNYYSIFAIRAKHVTIPAVAPSGARQVPIQRTYLTLCTARSSDLCAVTVPAMASKETPTAKAFGGLWHPGLHFIVVAFMLAQMERIPNPNLPTFRANLAEERTALSTSLSDWVHQIRTSGQQDQKVHFTRCVKVAEQLQEPEAHNAARVVCDVCGFPTHTRRFCCQVAACGVTLCELCETRHDPSHSLTLLKETAPIVDQPVIDPDAPQYARRILKHKRVAGVYRFQVRFEGMILDTYLTREQIENDNLLIEYVRLRPKLKKHIEADTGPLVAGV